MLTQIRTSIGLIALASLLFTACQPAPGQPTQPTPTPRPAAVSVARIQRGDIKATLAYTGDVLAGARVSILPKVAGQVTKLDLEVGSAVETGQVIAEIDKEAIDLQVAGAEAALRLVQARLESLQSGPRQEQVAQAEANLKSARERLAGMKAGGRSEQIAQVEANLAAARERLTALKEGGRSEQIGQARANLKAAQARLDQLLAGPTDKQRKAAELQVQQAKNTLNAANVDKDGTCGNPRNPDYLCKAAEARAFAATTGVDQATAQLNVITDPPTDEAKAQAKAAVEAAEQQLALAQSPYSGVQKH